MINAMAKMAIGSIVWHLSVHGKLSLSHVRSLWHTVGSDILVIWWSINLLIHSMLAHTHPTIFFIPLIQVCSCISDYTPLQPQRQWSGFHCSHRSSQSTATKQVTGRTEVSCKLNVLPSHSLLALILEYMDSLQLPLNIIATWRSIRVGCWMSLQNGVM